MSDEDADPATRLALCATEIVAAYVSHHHVPHGDVPALIETVHASLAGLGARRSQAEPEPTTTRAQIRRSITPDGLISFIDGKPYKMLRGHLSRNGLDAHSYRQRFGLPSDYPMVAPSYSERRSAISKRHHLGKHNRARPSPRRL